MCLKDTWVAVSAHAGLLCRYNATAAECPAVPKRVHIDCGKLSSNAALSKSFENCDL
jgi:hypothetical protein